MLESCSPPELRRLFALIAEGKLPSLPIVAHSEPFVQYTSDLIPLPYNPLPRYDTRSRVPTLLNPFFD